MGGRYKEKTILVGVGVVMSSIVAGDRNRETTCSDTGRAAEEHTPARQSQSGQQLGPSDSVEESIDG